MQQHGAVILRRRRLKWKKIILLFLAVFLILLPPVCIVVANRILPAQPRPTVTAARVEADTEAAGVSGEEEPETASSEIRGRWYGLCGKNTISSIEDFRRTVDEDPVLGEHFADFNWEKAKIGHLEEAIWTSVSYRKEDKIAQTQKKVRLPAGDGFITDGIRHVRTYCCNDYIIPPPPPEIQSAPLMEKVDAAVRRREVVDGPQFQRSSHAPAQMSAGPPPPIAFAPDSPVITPKVVMVPNVPEPGTLLLVGSGLAGMVFMKWVKKRRK